MPSAELKHSNERFESLFRRFKKAVDKDNTLQEVRERERFEKPCIIRKRNKAAAKKRAVRAQQEKQLIKKKMY